MEDIFPCNALHQNRKTPLKLASLNSNLFIPLNIVGEIISQFNTVVFCSKIYPTLLECVLSTEFHHI